MIIVSTRFLQLKHHAWFVSVVIASHFFLLGLGIFSGSAQAAQDKKTPTIQAEPGTWQATFKATGKILPQWQSTLTLPFPVRVLKLPVEPGNAVMAGDTLAILQSPALEQHLIVWRDARRLRSTAQRHLKLLQQANQEQAVTRTAVSLGQQTLRDAELREDQAWAQVADDLFHLQHTANQSQLAEKLDHGNPQALAQSLSHLLAPFKGIVSNRPIALGQQIPSDTVLITVTATESVYIDIGIPEADLELWQDGSNYLFSQKTKLPLQGPLGPGRYAADSGLWILRFTTTAPNANLQAGQWVTVQHHAPPKPVLWVPAEAVVMRNLQAWCVLQSGERFRAVPVSIGQAEHGRIPVFSGITPEDRIVAEGAYELLYQDLKQLIKFVD